MSGQVSRPQAEEVARLLERAECGGIVLASDGIPSIVFADWDVVGRLARDWERLTAALRWYEDHKRDDGSYDGAMYGDLAALAFGEPAPTEGTA